MPSVMLLQGGDTAMETQTHAQKALEAPTPHPSELLRGRKFHVLYCTEVPEAVRQMPEPVKGVGPRQWGQRSVSQWSADEMRAWRQGHWEAPGSADDEAADEGPWAH